jgi:hypothetical protein
MGAQMSSKNRRGSSSSSGSGCDACGAKKLSLLEIEAISAVKEVAAFVQSICISEVLSRTTDLIFLNLHTLEGDTYCIELTQRGWRVCSNREDCMNGDFRKLDFHSRYFETIYQLLDVISPLYREQYANALTAKLNQLSSTSDSPPPPQNDGSNQQPPGNDGNEKK